MSSEPIKVAGRTLYPTAVFDSYWSFAAERQQMYLRRVQGSPPPWTEDPIIASHRFTNPFRAADRVSQYLISDVVYGQETDDRSTVFRTLLFKFFNKIETWQHLVRAVGEPTFESFSHEAYDAALGAIILKKQPMYSAAYVIPPPRFGEERKHQNHLRLLRYMMGDRVLPELLRAQSMRSAYSVLRGVPSIGDFLAYQLITDLNYSPVFGFSELEFVVPGPGARDGIRKCFGDAAVGIESDVIRWMVDHQDTCFEARGLEPATLWGRPLQLVDAQNLFCEVDKYARVAHPEITTPSRRTRIKQKYRVNKSRLAQPWFPPDWGINEMIRPSPTPIELADEIESRQLTLV